MRLLVLVLSAVLISCSSSGPETTDSAGSKAYLEKAAAMPGAIRTASGLVYRELKAGTGPSPKATDVVKVHGPANTTNVASSPLRTWAPLSYQNY
jgi:hypothetical protein